jgi:2,5-diketo-D-gluconate reductase A
MNAAIPAIQITDTVAIPQLGFGVFKVTTDDAQRVVEDALAAGYRHLDTATAYRNEKEVGRAIAASGLRPDELFVTTKLWNSDQGKAATHAAFERSLDELGLERVDLYLIHWPVPPYGLYRETWTALQEIEATGRARAIGVSNFVQSHLEEILADGGVAPAVNQIELHPLNQDRELVEFCRAKGIAIEAYSPLARGTIVEHDGLGAIAAAHGKSVPQVILRWHLAHGNIVIPKTVTPERMAANIDVFDFELSADEIATIDALDQRDRIGADPLTFTGE